MSGGLLGTGEDAEQPEDDVEMGFFDHLGELRTRLMRALIGIVPCVGVAWFFKEQLLEAMLQPLIFAYHELKLGEPTIYFPNPVDPFVAYLKISILAGFLASSPWIFWQVWGFIAPGLYKKEKLLAIPFVLGSTLCFVGGAAFGYYIVFPMAFVTFLEFSGMITEANNIQITPNIMINDYLSLVTRLLLAFGVVFEVPVVVTFLAAMNIVNWRQLLSFGRWWIVIAAFLAAFLTPADVGSMLMMFVPLVVLYYLSVGIAFIIGFRREKKEAEEAENAVDEEGVEYER